MSRKMRSTPYYSVRTGKNESGGRLDLPMLRQLFASVYSDLTERGHFQEAFGYACVDEGEVPGFAGSNPSAFVLRKLKKSHLWPISDDSRYSEDDVFDLVELLFDVVSKGVDGHLHTFMDCGLHYESFDREQGRAEFRTAVNEILREYQDGYELSRDGEIQTLPPRGMSTLMSAETPTSAGSAVTTKVDAAVKKFRRRGASEDERRDAIRDLVDVLEYLRPEVKKVLTSSDERDLFNIANNFGIRHHRPDQLTQYDKPVWYSWMFYFYLATIHACLRLIEKDRS